MNFRLSSLFAIALVAAALATSPAVAIATESTAPADCVVSLLQASETGGRGSTRVTPVPQGGAGATCTATIRLSAVTPIIASPGTFTVTSTESPISGATTSSSITSAATTSSSSSSPTSSASTTASVLVSSAAASGTNAGQRIEMPHSLLASVPLLSLAITVALLAGSLTLA